MGRCFFFKKLVAKPDMVVTIVGVPTIAAKSLIIATYAIENRFMVSPGSGALSAVKDADIFLRRNLGRWRQLIRWARAMIAEDIDRTELPTRSHVHDGA
jgi:hypothetical protein